MKNLIYSLFFIFLFSGSAFAQLSGERTVPSDNYPNLQTVADSLNLYGVGSGGINFMIAGGTTFEETSIEFSASGNADDPIYIGWNGEGEKPHVNFDGSDADNDIGFSLIGVSYYTLDGIKITNSNLNLERGVLITNFDSETGASYNVIKNMEIILDKENPYQTVGISVNTQAIPSEFNGNNHYNKFYNNNISNVLIGYTFDGGTGTTPNMAVGNEVGTQDGGQSIISDIVMAGITTQNQNGFSITNTTIRDLTRLGGGVTAPAAIATSDNNPTEDLTNEFIISNNVIEDMTSSTTSIFGMYLTARKTTYQINNNKIHNITATGGGSNTADGIFVFATGVVANIYNNMVSGIAAPASAVAGNNIVTRGISARTYDQLNLFYNTVVLEYEATNLANRSAPISIFNNSAPVLMRNNIFINKSTLPEGSVGTVAAIHKRNNNMTGLMSATDNNIYYAGAPGPQNLIFYGFHASSPLNLETLEAYQTSADSFDQNSYTEDVPFISADDLHIPASATTLAKDNASPVTEPIVITTDIDGSIRDTETPDIGADEIASTEMLLAINPNPENGAIDISAGLSELSWEYLTSPEYTLPEAFLVYINESADFDGVTPVATVLLEAGETNYSAAIENLNALTEYFWKVVPITAVENGDPADNVIVWSFTTGIYLAPNAAENPSPDNNGTVDLSEDHVIVFGWDYIPSENHSLPTHFEIYGASDMSAVEWETPIAQIDYVEDQVSYTIELIDNPNFTYELETENFWKIVPVSADNIEASEVPVWSFWFESTIGLNDLKLAAGTVIYPNPAADFLNIDPGFDGKYEVMLYDVQGRLVKHLGEAEGKRTIPVVSVQSGAYQLVLKQGDLRFTSLIKVN